MKRRSLTQSLLYAAVGCGVLPTWAQTNRAPLRVAAASDLKFVLPHLIKVFEQQTGQRVELQFGSSGNFAQQIKQGLPIDVFMSADESYIFDLADTGLTQNLQDRGAVYATGRIALLVPQYSPWMQPNLNQADPITLAQLQNIRKFAIANPEHAPYGRAAREVLQKLGLWEPVKPKLVLGDNIAQTTQFVTSGAAQAGITALSLAVAPEISALSRYWLIPAHLHSPMRQRMVQLKSAQPSARILQEYLMSADVKKVFARSGFSQ